MNTQRHRLATWVAPWLAVLACSGGCAVSYPEHLPRGDPPTSLAADLDCLQQSFNRNADRHRVLAFLSPTCPYSRRFLEALGEALEDRPEAEVKVLVVWSDELPGDGSEAARRAAMSLMDPRVEFFHDARRRAASVMVQGVLPTGAARRTLFSYKPGLTWDQQPPRPSHVVHQLGRLAPGAYCETDQLASALIESWR